MTELLCPGNGCPASKHCGRYLDDKGDYMAKPPYVEGEYFSCDMYVGEISKYNRVQFLTRITKMADKKGY